MRSLIIVLGLAVILAPGCGDEPRRAQPAVKPAVAAKPAPAAADPAADAAVEEQKEVEPEYVYSPIGKRDPFRNPFQLDPDPTPSGGNDPKANLQDTQKWDVEQLTVRAIVSATSNPMAMVIDPKGKGHVVKRGTLIGRNWGRVSAIRRDCIVITEQMRDATGAVITVRQEKCLPKTDRELALENQID